MAESLTTAQDDNPRGGRWRRTRAWGGYIWFMSFGTFLPLPVFLCGYLAQLTFFGAPLARLAYRFGVFLSTLGQSPPGADKLESRRGPAPARRGSSSSAGGSVRSGPASPGASYSSRIHSRP